MSHGILIALTGDLEQQVVAAVDGKSDLVVVRRCADMAELVAAALAGLGAVAVIDADHDVDRPLLARLAQAGTRSVVICDGRERARYEGMGVGVVAREDGAAAVLEAIGTAVAVAPHVPAPEAESPQGPTASRVRSGGLVVVWGPAGSPGRSTVAINLAAEIAAAGQRTLLIDADLWGAAIAPTMGLLEESAGLAAAVRAADQGTLDQSALQRLCSRVNDHLLVLPGLPRASRWREVSGVSIDEVWQTARRMAEWVVVDAATWVPDDDHQGGFDAVLGPRRNAVTASLMSSADALVIVGAAEPIGIQRLVQAVLDLEERGGAPARRQVVVTRLRAEAAGPRPADSVREALNRFAGVDDVLIVPDDRAACDKAALAGAALGEVAPRSAAREAIAALAHRIAGPPTATGRRRGARGRVLKAPKAAKAQQAAKNPTAPRPSARSTAAAPGQQSLPGQQQHPGRPSTPPNA